MSPSIRECSLRREFATLYPGIEPAVWEIAANVVERVVTRRQWRGADQDASARPLRNEHFAFRGGRRQSRPGARSRLGDTPAAP